MSIKRALIFLGLTFLIYHPALFNKYALDDIPLVRDNPVVTGEAPWTSLLTQPYWDATQHPGRGLYRPLTLATFRIIHATGENAVVINHALNLVLHGIVCGLIFLFVVQMGLPVSTATWGTLLYLVHPVHSEVIAGMVGRTDLLAALFFFSALVTILKKSDLSVLRMILVFVMMFLSFCSKESGIAAILMVPIILIQLQRRWFRSVIPVGLATVAYVTLRYSVVHAMGVAEKGQDFLSGGILSRAWGALAYFTFYIEKIFAPLPLSPDYGSGVFDIGDGEYYFRAAIALAFLILVIAAVLITVLKKKALPIWLGAIVLFIVAILPVSNLIFPIGSPFGERFLYLPMPFLILLLHNRWFERKWIYVITGFVMFLLAGISWIRSAQWYDNMTLFAAGVRDVPTNFHMQMSLASELEKEKYPEKALEHFQVASVIRPNRFEPYMGMAKVAFDQKNYKEAQKLYWMALDRAPFEHHYEIHYNLVHTYLRLGQKDQAIFHLNRTLKLRPDFHEALMLREILK